MDILVQFVPFLTILAITGFSIWWSRRKVRIADASGIDLKLQGFRGWLLVLAASVILSVAAALLGIYEIVAGMGAGALKANSAIASAKFTIVLASLGLSLLAFYLTIGRRRAFVKSFIAVALFNVATGLALDLLSATAGEIEPWEVGSATAGHSTVASAIFAAIWIGYVLRSRRVKNIFVR